MGSSTHAQNRSGLPRRYESTAIVAAPAEQVFAHIDDHAQLSDHMTKSSWMMGGGRMTLELDEGRGREVGSRIRLAGRVFGMELSVEEVVIEHRPPHSKAWETVGSPKLLVVERYRMGFELQPRGEHSELRVRIEYELPRGPVTRWLGRLLGGVFARWCTRRMVDDAVKYFASALPARARRFNP